MESDEVKIARLEKELREKKDELITVRAQRLRLEQVNAGQAGELIAFREMMELTLEKLKG